MGETDCGGNWVLFWMAGPCSVNLSSDFLLMDGVVFAPYCSTWDQMVEVMKIMVKSFKRSHARNAALHVTDPVAGHWWSTPPPETPVDSQACLGQSLIVSLLLSPGSWCAQSFVCALQESVSPVLCKFCNWIPLASKVKFFGGSQSLCQIPKVGKSVEGPRTLRVWECIWYNCSQFVRLLLGGSMVGLITISSKTVYATHCVTQVCCTENHCPCGRPLLTHTCARDTQTLKRRPGSVSVGSLDSGEHKVLFEPSRHLWWVWRLILTAISPLLPSCCGFSFALGSRVSYLVGANILLLMVVQQRDVILEFMQERMNASPSTLPSYVRPRGSTHLYVFRYICSLLYQWWSVAALPQYEDSICKSIGFWSKHLHLHMWDKWCGAPQ